MLATFHRPPILAAVGLFAAVLVRVPRSTATVSQVPAGCPMVIPEPVVVAPPNLIYISNDALAPPVQAPTLR
jgi:hypothetical protein